MLLARRPVITRSVATRLLSDTARLQSAISDRAAGLQRRLAAQQLEERLQKKQQQQDAVNQAADEQQQQPGSGTESALEVAMLRIEARKRGDRALHAEDCTAALELSMKCKSGAVREAQLVLREMEREGLPPSPHDLALATTTFAWNKRGELAATWRGKTLAALDRAADTCPVAMRDASLELLLQSCKVGHDMPAARSTWEWMRARDIWPTPGGLSHLLVACARQHECQFVLETLRTCEAEFAATASTASEPTTSAADTGAPTGGVETSVLHWNVVLSSFVRANLLRTAEDLLEELEARADNAPRDVPSDAPSDGPSDGPSDTTRNVSRIAPDTVSYNTLLHGYAIEWGGGEGFAQRVQRFADLLGRMDGRGLTRDDTTYRAMLDLYQYDADAVMTVVAEAEARGVPWRWRTYGKVARTLWWARRADDAWALTRRMLDAGVAADARYFHASVLAAESVGLIDEADKLHREALRLEAAAGEASRHRPRRRKPAAAEGARAES